MIFYRNKYSEKLKSIRHEYGSLCVLSTILIAMMVVIIMIGYCIDDIDSSQMVVEFSQESGFYDEPFMLSLSTTDKTGKVYYTTDGSIPDKNSHEYKEPIRISDATLSENIYSIRTDTSTGYDVERIQSYGQIPPGYKTPDYPVDKCTIICARVIDKSGLEGQPVFKTYFVDYKNRYTNCYMMSIQTSPDQLFDYENGIYVTGKDFASLFDNSVPTSWWTWPANYTRKGKESERFAHISLFNQANDLVIDVYDDPYSKVLDKKDGIFVSLMKNEEFQDLYYDKLMYLTENCFTEDSVNEAINVIDELMSDVIGNEYKRFYGSDNHMYEEYYCAQIDEIQTFFLKRNEYIKEYCATNRP